MATLTILHLPHLPETLVIHIALYSSVLNAQHLHTQLLQGNSEFEYALIDATSVISIRHVLAAIFRASNDFLNHRLKSRNVHSEIVFSLGSTNNIARTLRAHGISPTTTNLIAIKITHPSLPPVDADTISNHLSTSINGVCLPFTDSSIRPMTDLAKVGDLYKLNVPGISSGKGGKGGKKGSGRWRKDGGLEGEREEKGALEESGERDEEAERVELEMQVLGLMALRGLS